MTRRTCPQCGSDDPSILLHACRVAPDGAFNDWHIYAPEPPWGMRLARPFRKALAHIGTHEGEEGHA